MNVGKILCNYQRNWFFRFQCVYVQYDFTISLFAKRKKKKKKAIDEAGAGFSLEVFT